MNRIAIVALVAITLLLHPAAAWGQQQELYRVTYRGPYFTLTENGRDFFAHMKGFEPGQTQSGSFVCENLSPHPVAIEMRLVPENNRLGQYLSTEIRQTDESGAVLGRVSANHQDPVQLCQLKPGQTASFGFLASVAPDAPQGTEPTKGTVRWEFIAKTLKNDGTGSIAEDTLGGGQLIGAKGDGATDGPTAPAENTMPLTSDNLATGTVLLATLTAATAALLLSIHRARQTPN